MSGVRKFEHATLHVRDLEAAERFYTDLLGLVEVDRIGDTVYLGCGLDENFDLGLVEGGTGVEHIAVRVADTKRLAELEERLWGADIETEQTGGYEPGQLEGVRFTLPSGVDLELVTVADQRYHHPTQPVEGRDRLAPLDVDHANLMSYDIDTDLTVLTEILDFAISDSIVSESGFTVQAWLRRGDYHHDLALSTADNIAVTLHHLSFEYESYDHIKAACDRLTAAGHQLELGPNRHNAGSNLFAYLWTPGGNRIELTAEMATLDEGTTPGIRELREGMNTISSWGGVSPTRKFIEHGS